MADTVTRVISFRVLSHTRSRNNGEAKPVFPSQFTDKPNTSHSKRSISYTFSPFVTPFQTSEPKGKGRRTSHCWRLSNWQARAAIHHVSETSCIFRVLRGQAIYCRTFELVKEYAFCLLNNIVSETLDPVSYQFHVTCTHGKC